MFGYYKKSYNTDNMYIIFFGKPKEKNNIENNIEMSELYFFSIFL